MRGCGLGGRDAWEEVSGLVCELWLPSACSRPDEQELRLVGLFGGWMGALQVRMESPRRENEMAPKRFRCLIHVLYAAGLLMNGVKRGTGGVETITSPG